MRYEGMVYRPPSEARSLIIQLTIGCARNTCTFCSMYKEKKFRVRRLEEVAEDLRSAKQYYGSYVQRIFLADGDALVVKTEDLLSILKVIRQLFPRLERVSAYGAPLDVLAKTPEELKLLKEAGLDMIYIGAESGDDEILQDVKKQATAEQIREACLKLKAAGIKVSVTLISGLGGRDRLEQHAVASGRLISAVKPEYVSILTLMLEPGTPLYEQHKAGKFELLTADEVAREMVLFLENTDSQGSIFPIKSRFQLCAAGRNPEPGYAEASGTASSGNGAARLQAGGLPGTVRRGCFSCRSYRAGSRNNRKEEKI